MKSYNTVAMRGNADYTDDQFFEDMRDSGIVIPQHLLYTPQLNDYVMNAVNAQAVNDMMKYEVKDPDTGEPYTQDAAQKYADRFTSAARGNIHQLQSEYDKQ